MGRRQVACAAAHPGLTCRSHQSCYALAADTNAGRHQLDMDPGEPVRAARADVNSSAFSSKNGNKLERIHVARAGMLSLIRTSP
jgi:hypothetical protein